MSIEINDLDIINIKVGDTQVNKVMYQNEQVWPVNYITLKTNFLGKVSGSMVENINRASWINSNTLSSTSTNELTNVDYEAISVLDGNVYSQSSTYAQFQFQFPILEHLERLMGSEFWIYGTDFSQKMQVINERVVSIAINIYGSLSGNAWVVCHMKRNDGVFINSGDIAEPPSITDIREMTVELTNDFILSNGNIEGSYNTRRIGAVQVVDYIEMVVKITEN